MKIVSLKSQTSSYGFDIFRIILYSSRGKIQSSIKWNSDATAAGLFILLTHGKCNTCFRKLRKSEENKAILASSIVERAVKPIHPAVLKEKLNGLRRGNHEGMCSRFSLMHNLMEFDLIAFKPNICAVYICFYVSIPNWTNFGIFREQNIQPFHQKVLKRILGHIN